MNAAARGARAGLVTPGPGRWTAAPPGEITPHEWACFLDGAQAGEFDRP
jgi:hypothetical protein